MRVVVLLGPQRLRPTLAAVMDSLEIGGRVAAVTAGWQERETEDDELRQHLGSRTENLRLYERAADVFRSDPDLAEAHRRLQTRIREQQELYRLRLGHCLAAARQLLARDERTPQVERQTEAALAAVRQLDTDHLAGLQGMRREFEDQQGLRDRPAIAKHRGDLAGVLEQSSALAIAGGHVAVLLNRLRLFGLLELTAGLPLLAWSAGAMALASRVVVFHDSPPQGSGDAEVLDSGLAAFPEILPLPHARRRLLLEDARRVALFSRRFAPDRCVPLDEGARLSWNGTFWSAPDGLQQLANNGSLIPFAEGSKTPNGQR